MSLLLEISYSGWTLIRDDVRIAFARCKQPLYAVSLNLLDSYLPLVLSIYSISFKMNNFDDYLLSMRFVWLLFYCLKRHHYDKAPLVWLSNLLFWEQKKYPFFDTFRSCLNATDKYGIENAHSIIRAQTNDGNTADFMQRKAKAIFQSKTNQGSFRSQFSPPKSCIFSRNNLR